MKTVMQYLRVNSLAPGRFGCGFKYVCVMMKFILVIYTLSIFSEMALRRMPQNLTDTKSTLFQVMVWCHQARRYYLNQWWPSLRTPYGVNRGKHLRYQVLLIHTHIHRVLQQTVEQSSLFTMRLVFSEVQQVKGQAVRTQSDIYILLQSLCCREYYIDGLVQERRNSSALAMELHLSCTNSSIPGWTTW